MTANVFGVASYCKKKALKRYEFFFDLKQFRITSLLIEETFKTNG